MSFSSTNNLSGFPQPLSRVFPAPILAQRAPTSSDLGFPIGQAWINEAGDTAYILVDITAGAATWVSTGGGTTALSQLTGDTGTALPSGGSIKIAGTTNQVTTTGSGSQVEVAFATPNFTLTNNIALMQGSVSGDITIEAFNTSNTAGSVAVVASVATDNNAYFIATDDQANLSWSFGNSNDSSHNFLFTTDVDLSVTQATLTRTGTLSVAGSLAALAGNVSGTNSSSGAVVTSSIANTSNTASSDAQHAATVAGSSAGDPYFRATIAGVKDWVFGVDNSDSDAFVISNSGTIGTGNVMRADVATSGVSFPNGSVSIPLATTGLVLNPTVNSGAASGTVNCNGRVGSVTFTGVSVAQNADITLTMGNTSITGASTRCIFSMSGATTNSALTVKSYTPSANQVVWVVTNGGTATSTANITFDFIVLN